MKKASLCLLLLLPLVCQAQSPVPQNFSADQDHQDMMNQLGIKSLRDGLLHGDLALRQHDGGHTDVPNIPYFIDWKRYMLSHSAIR